MTLGCTQHFQQNNNIFWCVTNVLGVSVLRDFTAKTLQHDARYYNCI